MERHESCQSGGAIATAAFHCKELRAIAGGLATGRNGSRHERNTRANFGANSAEFFFFFNARAASGENFFSL
jgi:hypothetical protein